MLKISIGENTMKKIMTFILAVISILSISILFTGCGTQTVDDIAGEYIWIEKGKEKEEPSKHYYLLILNKDITYQNKSAIQLRFSEQRYNPSLDKNYYVNSDFYIDPKTLKSFESENNHFNINDKKNIVLNSEEYKKISSNTIKPENTNYTAINLIDDLIKIPKFNELYHKQIPDEFSGYITELDKLVYY